MRTRLAHQTIPSYRLTAAGASDPGVSDRRNEDALWLGRRTGLYLVADGMGGLRDGHLASKLAIDKFRQQLSQPRLVGDADGEPLGAAEAKNMLLQAFQSAHQSIKHRAQQVYGPGSMGSTLVSWWLPDKRGPIWIGNVGDSRAYRLHDGKLTQLSEDHTLYHQLSSASELALGPIDPDTRRLLSQALGSSQFIAPHLCRVDVVPDDRFLLCSDGLSSVVSDEELQDLLGQGSPRHASVQLVNLARQRGGQDNISVIVICLAR